MGMPFVVVTDHAALRALQPKESLDGCLQRYAKKLLGLEFNIQYLPGAKNFMQDLLLRVLLVIESRDACLPGELKESEVAAWMNWVWVPLTKRGRFLGIFMSSREVTSTLRSSTRLLPPGFGGTIFAREYRRLWTPACCARSLRWSRPTTRFSQTIPTTL